MDKTNNQTYLVGGFEFYTKVDADAASKEKDGIEYLKQKADFTNPITVLNAYDKLLEKELFQTPVGYSNLLEIQKFLKEQKTIDISDIRNIPVKNNVLFTKTEDVGNKRENLDQNSSTMKKKIKDYKQFYKNSLLLNILLIIAIIIMFYITYTGENATILDYETKIIDRYSQWEQELMEREKALEFLESK